MEHVLDNPAWNALISGNRKLAYGNDAIKYFAKDVSPFIGFKETASNNFRLLHDLIPHNNPVILISPKETEVAGEWKVLNCIGGFQMVYNQPDELPEEVNVEITPLKKEHVPQMLALTKLTNPGPFAERTIDFGHYNGIFKGEELVAMAGQRLHIFEYAEISAVCTHPDYLGKGYAKQLLKHQVRRIKAASDIPFLHVRFDNMRAIQVYESLGFAVRTEIFFYVIQKQS
ncbi:GNAT family N-acetyltransferase [Mucilaginibacter arboris]|uniref:GNAT family N-acetyltransferase n=1 Tax=Mucilaginibacter arboris TaxID=2682090 RepID=A0A7K1T0K7_9SPHI|nr:GNAT family N-acetyltransferase [Mucilaginibacter arboris]MVN23068.1 GNAT family N-acetyltransferase [Mucilaginibacter arboris]